jgi:hypothetical protein
VFSKIFIKVTHQLKIILFGDSMRTIIKAEKPLNPTSRLCPPSPKRIIVEKYFTEKAETPDLLPLQSDLTCDKKH